MRTTGREPVRIRREDLARDLRSAVRGLRRFPALTASVLVTLMVAVGLAVALLGAVETGLRHAEPLTSPRGIPLPPQTAAALGTGGSPPQSEVRSAVWGFDAREARAMPQTIEQAQREALRQLLLIARAAVLLTLALACINLILLLMTKASTQRRDLVLRTLLGAGPRRLAVQLAVEAGVVVAIGAWLGAILGTVLLLMLRRNWPAGVTDWLSPLILQPFALAAAAVPLLVAALATVLPARWGEPSAPGEASGGAVRSTASRSERAIRNRLSALSIAGSVVLLTGAGLLTRSFGAESVGRDPGFDPTDTLALSLRVPAGYAADPEVRATYLTAMLSGVAAMPGVRDPALASQGSELGLGTAGEVHALTGNPTRPGMLLPARHLSVSPGYFAAMGVPVIGGREFTQADRAYTPGVVVVNRTFANRFFAGGDPIGKYVHLGRLTLEPEWLQVVGVVGDLRPAGLGASAEPPSPAIYFSMMQVPPAALTLTVRADDPIAAADAVERSLRFIEPAQRIDNARLLTEVLQDFAAPLRWTGLLFGAISLWGVVLAGAGMYGVMSFNIAQRTKEIGIRTAIGATPRQMVRLVLTEAARLTLGGIVLGLFGAVCLARLLQYLFHGVEPLEPLVYLTVIALLGLTSLAAGWLPARSAAALDPAIALRGE